MEKIVTCDQGRENAFEFDLKKKIRRKIAFRL